MGSGTYSKETTGYFFRSKHLLRKEEKEPHMKQSIDQELS